jgi:CitMHS family citrate-Mg2+:H+ or citrate-Ca2+:H+ symporter
MLLAFAVVYFGLMNDAGLFRPVIRRLTGKAGGDPVRVALGTAGVATVAHLDGAGASTFLVAIPALLPLYRTLGMDPLVLTCITALAAGTMNMLPWGGPTARAAAVLEVPSASIFTSLIPAMGIGLACVFLFALHLGRRERRRLVGASAPPQAVRVTEATAPEAMATVPTAGEAPPRFRLNLGLTLLTLVALFTEVVPNPVVFVVASALALLLNFGDPERQRERLTAHGANAMMMVTTLAAAGVFTGILTRSGMLSSLSRDLVAALPTGVLEHLPVLLGLASMPLSLVFDPDSFYFGLLPVLAEASQAAGGSALEVGRAAVLGQMTTGFPVSPLTPGTFLLVGLAGVDLGDHQRRTIPYAFAITTVMTLTALATRAISL